MILHSCCRIALLLLLPGFIYCQTFTDLHPVGVPVQHDGDQSGDTLTLGAGAAWFDVNNDGNLDLYITMRVGANLLFIGDGTGGFIESAALFGLQDAAGDGCAVAIADFNNDGFDDVFLANGGSDRLLKNMNGTGFVDITALAGFDLTDQSRATSATWVDFDNDGFLDLFITHHVPVSGSTNASSQDRLFHNEGNETFIDVSVLLSDAGNISGYGSSAKWTDIDLDGDQDLIIINQCVPFNPVPNQIFRNDRNTHPFLSWNFTEIGSLLGADSCACAHGLDLGDFNNDGMPDFFYSGTGPATLMRNDLSSFTDISSAAGVNGQPSSNFSWGINFFDADLDGWQDVFVVLGSNQLVSSQDPQPDMFFLNNQNGLDFTDFSSILNLNDSTRGRVAIAGDFDNDGDQDLVLVNYGENIIIKRNDIVHAHHYIKVDLEGTISNRNGIGARITIKTPDGATQIRELQSGGSGLYVHFGLGSNKKVDSMFVAWPAGHIQLVTNILADREIKILEFDPTSPILQFEEVAMSSGIDATCGDCSFGNGVSFVDFNGDGLDDLTFGTPAGDSVLFYQNTGNGFQKLPALVDCVENTKQPLWIDLENDGDLDLVLANLMGQNRIYQNNGNLQFVEITNTAGFAIQSDPTNSVAAADYDADGDLDIYFGNWSIASTYTNYLYRNNGNGTFTDVTVQAGVADNYRLTLCSAFLDYDNDGWLDLYNSQDRYTDPNSLFKNNGDGTFTDVSVASESNAAVNAMNVGVGDYDHDSHLDIYITNTTQGNVLLHNQGDGTFVDVAADLGVLMNKTTWGGNFVDLDLDNDLDLYVCAMLHTASSSSDLFVNQYPLDTFIAIVPPGMEGDTLNSFSNAIGDFNNDGKPDIAVNNSSIAADTSKFQLWLNKSNVSGHWLKVKLRGVESNRHGIGSRIEYFIDGNKYIRSTHSGIAYLAQNSLTEIIGTGVSYSVDSVHVYWTSGFVSKLNDVLTGQCIYIYETDVLYVDKEATGEDNGLAWDDAFVHLEDALAFAELHHVKEIWIRSGTYVPHMNDRTKSFEIPDGVHIYGGFQGNETNLSQRDPAINPVELSGDIGVIGLAMDNSYHVISIGVNISDCIVDGLSITSGRADGTGAYQKRGAGVYCLGNASFTNVTILDCYSEEQGAAIYASGWRAQLQLEQLSLHSNISPMSRVVANNALAKIKILGINEIKY